MRGEGVSQKVRGSGGKGKETVVGEIDGRGGARCLTTKGRELEGMVLKGGP